MESNILPAIGHSRRYNRFSAWLYRREKTRIRKAIMEGVFENSCERAVKLAQLEISEIIDNLIELVGEHFQLAIRIERRIGFKNLFDLTLLASKRSDSSEEVHEYLTSTLLRFTDKFQHRTAAFDLVAKESTKLKKGSKDEMMTYIFLHLKLKGPIFQYLELTEKLGSHLGMFQQQQGSCSCDCGGMEAGTEEGGSLIDDGDEETDAMAPKEA